MSRTDAERAMEIYKNFTKQTDFVVAYLSTARQVEHQTRVEVPKLKHAPVNLGKQLEDYLMDPDFEINRRQYLAEQELKKGSKSGTNGVSKAFASTSKSEPEPKSVTAPQAAPMVVQPAKGPDSDLIDFFQSIEQNQQPMAAQPGMQQAPPQFNNGAPFQMQQGPQFQQNGFAQQQTSFQSPNQFPQQQQPFSMGFGGVQQPQQIQTNFTGASFGGYTPQPSFQPRNLSSIPQDSVASFQQQPPQQQLGNTQTGAPQTTNPFRQSMLMANQTGMSGPSFTPSPPVSTPVTRQSTNPFAKSTSPPSSQPFSPPAGQQFPQQQQPAPLQPAPTGTNPFAKNLTMNSAAQLPQTSGGLMPQPTGSTNPFRQSQFVNTATGVGWQNNQQPIGGGLDNLETVPVFPRPAQQQAWQQ
jgi:hypothetical protein